jgi:2-polyprenyl-6-methoxyphenol hydroxylase-like FAD-dependent oxidoreductase
MWRRVMMVSLSSLPGARPCAPCFWWEPTGCTAWCVGQGMNLGIHDAIALGRALSNVLEGRSPDLLDSYTATQRPMAQDVISTTDLLTNIATMGEPLSELRNVLVHVLDPMIRKRLAWRLSLLGYREEALRKMTAA